MYRAILGAASAIALTMGLSSAANAAIYTYVGSWHVGEGPVWTSNPPVYSGQSAAALLFGGTASNYAISTVDNSVANINFSAFVDGWADGQYLSTPVSQSFSLDTGGGGYNSNPGFGTAYSAYVLDHSCGNRYSNPNEVCPSTDTSINYAFRVSQVPEPASWAMLITGLGLTGFAMRRRQAAITA